MIMRAGAADRRDRRSGTKERRSLFRSLKFAHKVALMPGLAAAGFLLILVTSFGVGQRNGSLLDEIQKGYFPAFQASHELEDKLDKIQRNLQDAVSSRDASMLDETDRLKEDFQQQLSKLSENGTVESERVQSIQELFV
ncbi:MAG TPA: hypothetical protein VHU81_19520, partial [Thermoanaerobaculia bacterium]|nr:hypothetical protein [Thermoanaerobaculia bacterium]